MDEKQPTQVDVLLEIRDLLRSREEKYDLYLKQYEKHVEAQKEQSVSRWIWLCTSLTVAVFLGGLMLRAIVR